jgi:hypothetical protein
MDLHVPTGADKAGQHCQSCDGLNKVCGMQHLQHVRGREQSRADGHDQGRCAGVLHKSEVRRCEVWCVWRTLPRYRRDRWLHLFSRTVSSCRSGMQPAELGSSGSNNGMYGELVGTWCCQQSQQP